jgi:outer membrane protein assembly factor BamB
MGCSSAPEKPDPTPLERITEVIELDDVESIGLGGGDQTGLSPASSDGAIAAASATGEVYLLDQQLNELWNVDLDQTIVGGVGANATGSLCGHHRCEVGGIVTRQWFNTL